MPGMSGLGVLMKNTGCTIGVRISYDNMTKFYLGFLFWLVLRVPWMDVVFTALLYSSLFPVIVAYLFQEGDGLDLGDSVQLVRSCSINSTVNYISLIERHLWH